MDLLPPALRGYDGHPNARLAAAVITDLAKVGSPVYVVDDSDDHSHVTGGLTLRLNAPSRGVFLSWCVPNEDRLRGAQTAESAKVFAAAAALTTATLGILATFGHHVTTELSDPAFPYPFIYVLPRPTGSRK
jgi:hypothetical protein